MASTWRYWRYTLTLSEKDKDLINFLKASGNIAQAIRDGVRMLMAAKDDEAD